MKKLITILSTLVLAATGCTASAPATAPKTVTAPPVTKTVSAVPDACKEALKAADAVIATAGEGFGIVAGAMEAASNFDPTGITAATTKLDTLNEEKLTPQLEAYRVARDECNGS